MSRFSRVSITSAESDACNSLEGIEGYANLDTALVQQTNHWYRFFAASTVAPDGVTVIAPADITPPDPGRWFRQGIPALGGNRSQFPVAPGPCVPGGVTTVVQTASVDVEMQSRHIFTVSVPGAVVGNPVSVNPQGGLNGGSTRNLMLAWARVSAPDTVQIAVFAGGVDQPPDTIPSLEIDWNVTLL